MTAEVRLILKQYRFGLIGFGLILVGIAAVLVVLDLYLSTLDLGRCQVTVTAECSDILSAAGLPSFVATGLRGMASPTVVFAGVFLGVSIIATELERGTAVLAWTVGRSRVRWLASRVSVLLLLLVVASTVIGLALDAVQQTVEPTIPLAANLQGYETRGWLIPARAGVAFAAGLLAGAVLGRSLPALLSGTVIAAVAVVAVVGLGTFWNSLAVDPVGFNDGSIVNELVLRDETTGNYIDYASAEAIIPQNDPRFAERFTEAPLGLPGSSAPIAFARESAALVVGSFAMLAASFVITNRRKPY